MNDSLIHSISHFESVFDNIYIEKCSLIKINVLCIHIYTEHVVGMTSSIIQQEVFSLF